jgi:formate dehydrogenase major subunit
LLDIHPFDASERGVVDGGLVELASRVGATVLHARLSSRMPVGVVYTTFHHPVSGANVVTTEHSDWATNCPEYKVTAVQVKAVVGVVPGAREDVATESAIAEPVPLAPVAS